MKERDAFWAKVIAAKYDMMTEDGILECWWDHMVEGCRKDYIWERKSFRSVCIGELEMGVELVFGQIVG